MSVEHLVKRTVWVSECNCGKEIDDERRRRERFCPKCEDWFPYVEESYTGPEIGK